MKKSLALLALVLMFGAVQLGASANEPINGVFFKEAAQPGGGSGSVGVSKVGCATCTSYFAMVALGDCSITKAMKNGKISNLSHYDEDIVNILGYKKVTIKAYGQ